MSHDTRGPNRRRWGTAALTVGYPPHAPHCTDILILLGTQYVIGLQGYERPSLAAMGNQNTKENADGGVGA